MNDYIDSLYREAAKKKAKYAEATTTKERLALASEIAAIEYEIGREEREAVR